KDFPAYGCELKGDYQKHNIKTVLTVISLLQVHFSISKENIEKGLLQVSRNSGLKGRWQVLSEKPFVVCDTAHNEHGLRIVLEQLKALKYKTLHIVIGVVNDKDLEEILPLFPKKATYYFCSPNVSRGLDVKILQAKAKDFNLNGKIYSSVAEAYGKAMQNADKEDVVFIGGSTFTVAEVI